MKRGRKTSAEQVVLKLRAIEVQTAQGKSLALACKEAEISEQSYYRWRKEYGGLKLDQAKRLEQLEGENARLKRLLADDPAGVTLRETVLRSDAVHRLPASLGGYKFPEATSAKTCFSKDRSATSRRRRRFSRSRSFMRRA